MLVTDGQSSRKISTPGTTISRINSFPNILRSRQENKHISKSQLLNWYTLLHLGKCWDRYIRVNRSRNTNLEHQCWLMSGLVS